MVEIIPVQSKKDVKEFIEFPLRLYRNCSYFVPPLYGDEKKLLLSGGNTEIADSVFYLAKRDGKTVGRIQGIIQKQYNAAHNCAKARFTRFDSIDDTEVSNALFEAVERWGAEHGMTDVCGPLGYSDLDREGMLIEGFEEDSTFEEQYNYDYYPKLLEAAGYRKDVDWLEFELRTPEKRNPMLARVAERALELSKLHIASTNMSKRAYINKYRDGIFDCIDVCYSHLYGTVSISKETQDELVSQFMLIINKKYLIVLCDENDRVVGFGLCFPGIGNAVKKSGGRLTPAAICKLLHITNHPKVLDLALVAVRPEYQNAGVNAIMINGILELLESNGVEKCETNLNLETNTAVMAQWKYFNSRHHKRRRSYIKNI